MLLFLPNLKAPTEEQGDKLPRLDDWGWASSLGSSPYREVTRWVVCSDLGHWNWFPLLYAESHLVCIKENSSRDKTRKCALKTETKAVDDEFCGLQWREHSWNWHGWGLPGGGGFWAGPFPREWVLHCNWGVCACSTSQEFQPSHRPHGQCFVHSSSWILFLLN